jgi:signal transduction histidine kinase
MASRELTKAQLIEELEELRRQHENLVIESFEQKIVEGILKESREWLQHIIQQMPFPIEVSASDGSTTLINEAFLKVFEFKNIDDVLNRRNIFTDPLYSDILEDIRSVYRGEKIFVSEMNIKCPEYGNREKIRLDDGSCVFEIIVFPLVSLAGEVRRVVKIWKDITGYKRAQELLKNEQNKLETMVKERTEELAKANLAKDKFFSLISHDLKSPFNGMLGITNILVEDFDSLNKEEMRPFIENLRLSTSRIYNLIENLLEWSNVTLGRVPFSPAEVDVYEAALYAIVNYRTDAEKKDVKIDCNIKENTIVLADFGMLQSVFMRLVHNAVRFSGKGGRIDVRALEKGDMTEVVIEDSGVGITPQNLENIFKIDVNSKTPDFDNECGSGLGLIICKELVEKNGGELRISSRPGEGTLVCFTIPNKAVIN